MVDRGLYGLARLRKSHTNLDSAMDSVSITNDTKSSGKALRDATISASFEVLGLPYRKHQDWLDDNNTAVQRIIDQMLSSRKAWIENKNCFTKNIAYKKYKTSDRKDLKSFCAGVKIVFWPTREWGCSNLHVRS